MIICSYNIQYGTGKDGKIDLARIATEIDDCDIIALQEVERYFSSTGLTDQAAAIGDLFPRHFWVYGGGVNLDASLIADDGKVINRRRQFGNMLLSKWPIQSSRNHLLPKFGMVDQLALQRSALEGVSDTPDLGAVRVTQQYSTALPHRRWREHVTVCTTRLSRRVNNKSRRLNNTRPRCRPGSGGNT